MIDFAVVISFYQVFVFLCEVYFQRHKTFIVVGEGGVYKIDAIVAQTWEY